MELDMDLVADSRRRGAKRDDAVERGLDRGVIRDLTGERDRRDLRHLAGLI